MFYTCGPNEAMVVSGKRFAITQDVKEEEVHPS